MEIHPRTPEANLQYILNGLGEIMNNKYFNILASIILLLIIIPIEYLSYKYIN